MIRTHKGPETSSSIFDRVYLQMRSAAWGIPLGSGWSNGRGDARRKRWGAQVTQRPLRGGRGGRGSWYPRRRRRRRRGRKRGGGFRGGGKEWRGTSSSIGEVREECPDRIIQLSDITLGKRKSGVPEIQSCVTMGAVKLMEAGFRI